MGFVIQGQRRPAHRLHSDPLVQSQPAEQALRGLALSGSSGLRPELPGPYGRPIGGVALLPQLFVINIQLGDLLLVVPGQHRNAVQNGQPLRVVFIQLPLRPALTPSQQTAAFFVDFPTYSLPIRVIAGSGQHDNRLLPPGCVRTGGQYIPEPPIGLGVQLIHDNTAEGITVLSLCISAIYLHCPAKAAVDLPAAVSGPGYRLMSGLSQAAVLHHVFGRLVDDIRIVFIRSKNPNIGHPLPIGQQVI